jgi:hypothetical protein
MDTINFTHRCHPSTTNSALALPTRTDRRSGTEPGLLLSRRKDRQQLHLSNWPAMRSVAVLRYGNKRGPHPRRFYTRPVQIAGHATDGTDELPGTFAPQCHLAVQLSTQANAHVESFNGTLRAECLDVHWFATLRRPSKSSSLGGTNTMRVVLTDLWENERRVSSLVRSP